MAAVNIEQLGKLKLCKPTIFTEKSNVLAQFTVFFVELCIHALHLNTII